MDPMGGAMGVNPMDPMGATAPVTTQPATRTVGSVQNWAGPYLNVDTVPLDPWNQPFIYEYPSQLRNQDYPAIYSCGPDKTPNTEDDIKSWNPETEGRTTTAAPAPTNPMGTNPMDPMGTNPMDPMGGNPLDPMGGNPLDPMGGNPLDPMGGNPLDPMGGTVPPDPFGGGLDPMGGTVPPDPFGGGTLPPTP